MIGTKGALLTTFDTSDSCVRNMSFFQKRHTILHVPVELTIEAASFSSSNR